MSPSTPPHHPPQSYCLHPNCPHPENERHAQTCTSCGSSLLLQDRYRALTLLGQGGFGRTFKAIDETHPTQPYCTLKQFFPQQRSHQNRQKASELFYQEAQRLKTLGEHPRIPKLLAYFEHNQCQYLIQEFIPGRNLAQELAEAGPFDETKIRQLLNELLPILQFIHQQRVIHRDIKPENIIRPPQGGELVLVDFGAAKYTSETLLAKTGTTIGSPAYTAPEQIRGKATFASDLYSLGATCIHLLTEIPPFDLYDSGEATWVWRHFLSQPVSPALGKVVDKLLQGATKRRYQTATEVIRDLNATHPPTKSRNRWLATSVLLFIALASAYRLLSPPTQRSRNTVTPPPTVQPQTPPLPDTNGLYTTLDGVPQALPLLKTEVSAEVSGNLSRVEVRQTFTNPYDKPLEAVYQFPLPDDAAVDEMEIRIRDYIVRGEIKERREAQQIYEQAKQDGKTTALLEQERANIFTQSLANLLPGEQIDVVIRYSNGLKFEGGEYEFAFPMVVDPRYLPGSGTEGALDISNLNLPATPSELPSQQDIDLTLEIDAGVPIQAVRSPSHPVTIQQTGSTADVTLASEVITPDQDLIVRYQVAGIETQATVLTQADERGGHFATYLIPATEYDPREIVPKDVVFLIDTSGSQSGQPMEQSKALMREFIAQLNPQDTFTIINFSNTAARLSEQPLANTPANRRQALAYINRLTADGGTELMNGLNAVLEFPPASEGRLRNIVLLTDGLIGNDTHIIGEVQKRLQSGNRIYTFGVGGSTNRFLINRLAEVGRGTSEVLALLDSPQEVATEFVREVSRPVLANVEVTWIGEGEAPDIYPLQAPDLFASQPLVLYGRKPDRRSGQLRITGTLAGGERYEKVLNVNFEQVSGNSAIAQLWGRSRIKALMNQLYGHSTTEGIQAVTDTAIAYRLLSQYTAFVAVTKQVRVDPKTGEVIETVPEETSEQVSLSTNATTSEESTEAIPEPSQILGNLLALVLLGFWLRRKRQAKA